MQTLYYVTQNWRFSPQFAAFPLRPFFAASNTTEYQWPKSEVHSPASGYTVAVMHLGSVTYNVLKDMDLETIIKTLEAAGFEAVELRTEHKHGVEPSISPAERERVRKRFAASKIRLLS